MLEGTGLQKQLDHFDAVVSAVSSSPGSAAGNAWGEIWGVGDSKTQNTSQQLDIFQPCSNLSIASF